jgi:hypothetical protein
MNMKEHLHIIRHSLGLDDNGQGREYRNRFVTGEGSDNYQLCMGMVSDGLMIRRRGSELTGGDDLFQVTEAGRELEQANRPPVKKLTRSQARYRRFLNADIGWSFREFLEMDGKRAL